MLLWRWVPPLDVTLLRLRTVFRHNITLEMCTAFRRNVAKMCTAFSCNVTTEMCTTIRRNVAKVSCTVFGCNVPMEMCTAFSCNVTMEMCTAFSFNVTMEMCTAFRRNVTMEMGTAFRRNVAKVPCTACMVGADSGDTPEESCGQCCCGLITTVPSHTRATVKRQAVGSANKP